jgi:virulence-associated protein VagC
MTKVAVKVTPQGVLVPRPLIKAWGDVEEVEIEQRPDVLIITPKYRQADQTQARIVSDMRAAGLIENLPWAQPREVSAQERADLAKKLSQGKPLSEVILEDRESYA